MNLSFVKMPVLKRCAALAVAVAGSLAGASCTMFPPPEPGPGGPPFAPDGPHPYGYRGTQSPNYKDPRALPGVKEIKRDPNNDNINLEPPPPKNGNKPPETAEKPVENTNPPPDNTPPADPKPPVSVRDDLPYGIPVVGKKGMVYSPYAEDKGQVDVEGLKRGTRVKCPYTGKHFRVP
ncbi:MAG TPA: hypothetical protein VHM91_16230 [Verrucomicrobiales bacterium]|jgi:hypothetical protein|nr:hypothetical protein [Verrucomicrobiales bacterium]